MGEIADAMIWAEQNGLDAEDMQPEDWIKYYEDQKPMDANNIAFEAVLLRDWIKEWADVDNPPALKELVAELFPKLGPDHAAVVADGLQLLTEQYNPYHENEETDR